MSEKERSYTWEDPMPHIEKGMGLSGLDYMQKMIAGEMPPPPISQTMGFELSEVKEGRAVFTCIPADYHLNPLGTIHGGLACTLLDSAMSCAVHTTLPQGVAYTTLQVNINFTRAIRPDTGKLYCEGRVIHAGRQMATAEGTLRDENSKVYAHGTTTCLIFPIKKG